MSESHPSSLEKKFRAFQEKDLLYFERARWINQEESAAHERAFVRQLGKRLEAQLKGLGQELQQALSPIRADLTVQTQTLQGGRLPETLWMTLHRKGFQHQDAHLYLLLRDDGAEMGFGFGVHHITQQKQTQIRFTKQLQRFHKKAHRYLETLLQHDYIFWPRPRQTLHTPSQTNHQWSQKPGVILRLLPTPMLQTLSDQLVGVIAQTFGELVGLYAFLDRVYTQIPHIRSLHIQHPDELTNLSPEDDFHQIQSAASEWPIDFMHDVQAQGFSFSASLLRAYYLSLQTRPFVILTGKAGTGKSKLAQMFANFMMFDTQTPHGNPHIAFIPVRPDWLEPRALLGYYDSLSRTYRSTPFLSLLLRAHEDPSNPYFLILDELNLSRIEYYFSDFLSLMESRQYDREGQLTQQGFLSLHQESEPLVIPDPYGKELYLPAALPIPPNLYITGTMNIDETTHRPSPKVLDRANVIELQPSSPAHYLHWICQKELQTIQRDTASILRQRMAFIRQGYFTAPHRAQQLTLPPEHVVKLAASLETLFTLFQQANFEFGLRTVQEILDFAQNHDLLSSSQSAFEWMLDRQIVQKLLPRLHGPRQKLQHLLAKLLLFCWTPLDSEKGLHPIPTQVIENHRLSALGQQQDGPPPHLPSSAKKIAQMLTSLQHTSYIDFHSA